MKITLLSFLLFGLVASSTIYKVSQPKRVPHGFTASLSLVSGINKYGRDISPLQLDLYFETAQRFRIKISDPKAKRWEVPSFTLAQKREEWIDPKDADYVISWKENPFSIQVKRKADGEILFDSNVQSSTHDNLVFNDQYLEFGTVLPYNSTIFGLGEHTRPLRLDPRTYTLWNQDIGTPENINLYGSHPFYLELRKSGSHGVFLHNSNGMDAIYSRSASRDVLSFRVIGGIIDLYVFSGSSPEGTVMQYTDLVGKPYLPPYWALGFHQCRWGYKNIGDLEAVVDGYKKAEIPLETIWTDIDYMREYRDFTLDPVNFNPEKMKAFIDKLHSNGQKYTLIIDPGIKNETGYPTYDEGSQLGLWIKRPDGSDARGKVWPGTVTFPDWFHPKAFEWWKNQAKRFHDVVPFDGMWIDMNEPSNFCSGDCDRPPIPPNNPSKFQFNANFPPYKINNINGGQQPLWHNTLSVDNLHHNGILDYNVHNLFGYMEMWASQLAMESVRGERALVISRSSYSGAGKHAGHWTGDNQSTWSSFSRSIADVISLNLFGINLVGADICGFSGSTTEELCGRWIQVGAFYPFSRDHNSIGSPSQELYRWNSVAKIGKQVLNIRYSLLPYYYTLFWEANSGKGATVIRALWYEFSSDSQTWNIDKQFLIGKGIMVTPVLKEKATSVQGYFPPSTVWYDFYTNRSVSTGKQTLDAPFEKVNIHIRGGTVIPRQYPSMVLRDARNNPFSLTVAFDNNGISQGSLYIDDGKTINVGESYTLFNFLAKGASNGKFVIAGSAVKKGYSPALALPLNEVLVLGVPKQPTLLTLNGNAITSFKYDSVGKNVRVDTSGLNCTLSFTLDWIS